MESFQDILEVGGHTNSLGRANEVINIVEKDPTRLDELFGCIFVSDPWVRMRAIDTFEKIIKNNPELVRPYLDSIFINLTKSTQPSIQWHLAQIFAEVKLSAQERDKAISWLKDRIKNIEVDWIVSVNAMKSLLYFYKNGFINKNEIRPLFETQTNHKSKSVRKKADIFLQDL